VSSSEDEGSSDGDSDEEDENGPVEAEDPEALVAEWGVGAMAANPEEEIPLMDESKRCGRCCGGHSNWIGEKELCVQRQPGWIKSGRVHNMLVRCTMPDVYVQPACISDDSNDLVDGWRIPLFTCMQDCHCGSGLGSCQGSGHFCSPEVNGLPPL